jgi:hypothetical protein
VTNDTYVTHFWVHASVDDIRGVDRAVVAEAQGV